MRIVLLGLLCAIALSGTQLAVAAVDRAPGEEAMDNATPKAPAGSGEHPLCWLDIAAQDLAASREFYGKLFGWTFHELEGFEGYLMYMPPAGRPGGLTSLPHATAEGVQQSTPYIYTPDIDAELTALEGLGMRVIIPKTPINEYGSFAVFMDSAGTSYGLADTAPVLPVPVIPSVLGVGPKPPAGTLCSIELYGGDFAKAKALFGEHFGWGLAESMPQYMMFDAGAGIGGVFQSHTAVAQSMPYIWVDDVHAKIAEIEVAGGKRLGDPMAMPGMGTFGYFTDPSGVGMGLIGP